MIWRWLFLLLLAPVEAFGACIVQQRAVADLAISGTTLLVTVTVNDVAGTFILDTGAAFSVVTPDAVDRFHLRLDEWTTTTMRGVGGLEQRRNAIPRSIELGGVALRRRSVARDSTLRVATLPRGGVDGLLGRDFLSVFDLDLDVPGRRLTLYSVADCAGRFLPWSNDYLSVAVENPADSALVIPVELDGVRLRALLDTGAGQSLVAAPGMARLGLGLEQLRNDPGQVVNGMGPHTVTMWHHRFDRFLVDGQAFSPAVFLVAPIQLNPISDMLLGADWLMDRRIWISYATNQLFAALIASQTRPGVAGMSK